MLLQEEALPVFIYGLHCPLSGTIRYVGKSNNPAKRLAGHICAARRGDYAHHTARWLRSLLGQGLEPSITILHEVCEGERWQDVERQFIATAVDRGWRLTNTTAGGEGLDYLDPEDDRRYREKLSRSLKVVWNQPERIAEATARSRAIANNPELLAKRNAAIKRAHASPATRAKMVAAGREIGARADVKAAKSAKSRASWRDPSYRAAVTTARNDPAFTVKQGERLKARWADPAKRERMNSARWTPEKRREQADRIRAYNESRSKG